MTHQAPSSAPCEGTPGEGHRAATGDGRTSPVAARTMTPTEAAWVREQVWTQGMRKTHRECPGYYRSCACQGGTTYGCQEGRHDRCHRATPLRSYETLICDHTGVYPVYLAERYAHETDVSATGPRYERVAMVWLADRVCQWVCPCPCGHTAPAEEPEQLDLFAEAC